MAAVVREVERNYDIASGTTVLEAMKTMAAGGPAGMRLLVTPGTIVRWHRAVVCRRWGRCCAPAG
jgi:hypothetical protein